MDDEKFNKEEPRYSIIMKNEMPERYELQRSIGFKLTSGAVRRIVRETLTQYSNI